jgi:hypothetical protein
MIRRWLARLATAWPEPMNLTEPRVLLDFRVVIYPDGRWRAHASKLVPRTTENQKRVVGALLSAVSGYGKQEGIDLEMDLAWFEDAQPVDGGLSWRG